MEVVHRRCGGLDVHKRFVMACVVREDDGPGATGGGTVSRTIRRFGTMTGELLALADWLQREGVTHVAMESTGVYWQPIWNLLEGQFTLLLANAQHIKAVPGRKTDVKDSEWLADLLRHGLLKASFVPDRPQRELRELTRYRARLVEERSAEVNRLQKTLEDANLKLAMVASDITGHSARAMLAELVAGETNPAVLANLAQKRLRAKLPELEQALTGRFGAHHRFLVARQLTHLDDLDALIAEVSAEIGRRTQPPDPPDPAVAEFTVTPLVPAEHAPTASPPVPPTGSPSAGLPDPAAWSAAITRLDTIPGIGRRIAEGLVAEIGLDMQRFPSARHLAAWAGMCPGQHETGGKRQSGRTRRGNRTLRRLLVEAAHAASRTRNTYLAAQYRRLAARRGAKRAVVAVGHSILVIAYQLLARQTTYQDLGADYLDHRDRQAIERRAVRRLEALGYTVTLTPAA